LHTFYIIYVALFYVFGFLTLFVGNALNCLAKTFVPVVRAVD